MRNAARRYFSSINQIRFPKVLLSSTDHKFYLKTYSFLEKRLGWGDRDLVLFSFSKAVL